MQLDTPGTRLYQRHVVKLFSNGLYSRLRKRLGYLHATTYPLNYLCQDQARPFAPCNASLVVHSEGKVHTRVLAQMIDVHKVVDGKGGAIRAYTHIQTLHIMSLCLLLLSNGLVGRI